MRDNRPSHLAFAGLVLAALLAGCDQKGRQRAAADGRMNVVERGPRCGP